MRLELEKGVELLFSKTIEVSLVLFLYFLQSSFTSYAQRTFVTLQFVHPMTEKCSMINTSFDDGRFYLTQFFFTLQCKYARYLPM